MGLAARGARKLGEEEAEKIEDPAELVQVRRQAMKIQVKSFLTSVVLTGITLVLPG